MSKFIKWLGIGVFTLLILLIALLFILANTINPNRFKSLIRQEVYQATGRTLTIHGDIHWAFFPYVGLKVGQAELSSPASFGSTPFAAIKSAEASIKVSSLFSGTIQTGTLTLDEPTINLRQNKSGKNNWTFQGKKIKTQPGLSTPAKATKQKSYQLKFEVPKIDVRNATITWQDQKTGQYAQLNNMHLNIESIQMDYAFPIKLSFDLQNNKPFLRGHVNLTGNTTVVSPQKNQAMDLIKNLQFDGQLQIAQLVMNKLKIQKLQTPVQFKDSIINAKSIKSKFYGGALSGFTRVNLQRKMPSIGIKTQLSGINMNTLVADLSGHKHFTGTMSASANLNANGFDTFTKTLNGNARFTIKNGALSGIDVAHLIQTGRAILNQQPRPPRKGANETRFGTATGTIQIRSGIARCNDLRLLSSTIDVRGNGKANLVSQQLDYHLDANLSGDDRLSSPVPISISGPFTKLRTRLNVTKVVHNVVKDQIQKQVKRTLDKFKLNLF